jgi:hypothetical protein
MTTNTDERRSAAETFENDALLAGEAAAGAITGVEIAAIVLIGLLVCPPLAILVTVVVVPLLVLGIVLGLLLLVLAAPYLIVQHFRGHHAHASLLAHRLRGAAHALVDLLPHRIVADAKVTRPRR